MSGLKAPELPEGYFFRVSKDEDGDIVVTLWHNERKKKRLFFSSGKPTRIDRDIIFSYNYTGPAGVLKAMERQKERFEKKQREAEAISNVVGDYPPKTFIG